MPETTPRPRWRRVVANPWFPLVAAVVVTGLVLSFVAKPFWVPSASMEATLEPGDRVLVNRLAYLGGEPSAGDVVVFDAGPTWNIESAAPSNPIKDVLRWIGEVTGFGPTSAHTLIKRVIGTPGQKVECCTDDGHLLVDGKPQAEPYVTNDLPFVPGTLDCSTTPRSSRCFDPVEVPAGALLMLGDNRGNSADSALFCRGGAAPPGCWRWASPDEVVGKAIVILWPITRWSVL